MANILIADDDQTLSELVQRTMQADGHNTEVVGDGGEALVKLKSSTAIDVLIADIDMPVMDGIALASEVLIAEPDLRVLMISGMTERLEAAKVLPGKNLATLQKPFTLEALRAEIQKLLG